MSDRLRAAFEAGTERVPVAPDALGTIRAKVRRRAQRRRRAIAGLAGVATVGTATALVLLSSLLPVTPPVPGPPPPAGSSTVVTATSPATPPVPVTVPVYFSATVEGRAALYREYVTTTMTTTMPPTGGALAAALRLSIQGAAADPDYGTRWPAGARIRAVGWGSDVAWVDVIDVPPSAGADPLAVQQLVYTATAVLAELGEPATAVAVTIDGVAVPGAQPVTRASTVDTLAPVWLISPQQGASVGRTFDVQLAGTVWEAAARLRVRDATGAVVRDEPVQLDKGAPERGEAHTSLTLPPGRYTLEAYFVSQQDGREVGRDDHEITVS